MDWALSFEMAEYRAEKIYRKIQKRREGRDEDEEENE
jgi:hypothetical protein